MVTKKIINDPSSSNGEDRTEQNRREKEKRENTHSHSITHLISDMFRKTLLYSKNPNQNRINSDDVSLFFGRRGEGDLPRPPRLTMKSRRSPPSTSSRTRSVVMYSQQGGFLKRGGGRGRRRDKEKENKKNKKERNALILALSKNTSFN
jgi:hypothetical protein